MSETNGNECDALRNPFESNTEWRMRRRFLEAYMDRFPQDRLVCLSNCYVNVKLYGNKYPAGVMEQLKELVEGLQEDL